MKRPFLTLLTAIVPGAPLAAQSLKVTGITQSGTQITFIVQNTGASTSFRLESSPSMTAGTWNTVDGASFSPVAGQNGFHGTTITRPAATRLFYRVVGLSGTGDDTDGDGLSSNFERSIGTNPADFDSDRDGFSDGAEFVAGTDPKDPELRPLYANLPIVRFAEASRAVEEGAGIIALPMESDNGAYTGTVSIVVSTIGNAVAGTDFTVPATVSMTNGVASLPLTLLDNLTLSQNYRILVLEVRSPATPTQYTIGGGYNMTVVIGDNDAYWSGTLSDGDLQRNFRLKMLRQGSTSQVAFVAGNANDGLPSSSQAGTSDQSSGTIPVGTHAATVTANSATSFDISSPALAAGAQASLFGTALVLNRTLRLRAGTGITPSSIAAKTIYGTFTETVAAPGGASPHLTTSKTGTFGLMRDVPSQPILTP